MKKVFRIILYLIIGAIIAVLILPFVFKDELVDGLRQALNDSLNADVAFEDVSLNFWRDFPHARLSIDQLTIDGIDTFNSVRLFDSDRIDLSIDIGSLLSKAEPYKITDLNINSPVLNILVLDDGRANYLISKPSEDETAYEIELDKYSLKDGQLLYTDNGTDISIFANDVQHNGSGLLSQDIYNLSTSTESSDFTIQYGGVAYISSAHLTGKANLDLLLTEEKYFFKENRFALNDFEFGLDGFVQFLEDDDLMLDLKLNAPDADFAQLYSIIPTDYLIKGAKPNIKGAGQVEANLSGIMNSDKNLFPDYGLKIKIVDGRVQYPGLPHHLDQILADIDIINSGPSNQNISISVPRLSLAVNSDYIKGSVIVSGPINNPHINAKMDADLHLNKWTQTLPFRNAEMKGNAELKFQMNSDLQSIQNEKYENIQFSTDASLDRLIVKLDTTIDIKVNAIKIQADKQKLSTTYENIIFRNSDFSGKAHVINPLLYLTSPESLSGSIEVNSQRINANQFVRTVSEPDLKEPKSVDTPFQIFGSWSVKAKVDNLFYDTYNYQNSTLSFNTVQDQFNDIAINTTLGDSEIQMLGSLKDVQNFLNQSGNMIGNLTVRSDFLDLNDWMNQESSDTTLTVIPLPHHVQLKLKGDLDHIKYGNLQLAEVVATADLNNATLMLTEMTSKSLGGILNLQGSYSTEDVRKPFFDFKFDINQVEFGRAFREIATFRKIAPIAEYINGFFNTTIMMSGRLTENMTPVWPELNASGYLETIDGRITKFDPLADLAQKIGVPDLKSLQFRDSKNWLEIINGIVQIKENQIDLGQGIKMTIAGGHGIGSSMNYNLLFEIPRELLAKNALTDVANKGYDFLLDKAKGLGINVESGNNILVKVNMKGMLMNPVVTVTPIGMSDEEGKVVTQPTDILANQIDTLFHEGKQEVEDKIDARKQVLKESIDSTIDRSVKSIQDSIVKKASNHLDSLINRSIDSTGNATIDDLIQKTKKEEADKIAKKLEKWNPFKTKSNKDSTKISLPKSINN